MSDALLFGYSVEESDDKFVITLAGKLAVPIMQDIGANIGNGRGAGRLTGLFPYSLLASHAVGLSGRANAEPAQEREAELADIFGQGFDRDLDEYERHLERYRALLPASAALANGNGAHGEARSFGHEIDIEEKAKPKAAATKN